jgi:hypothetical protein
MAKPRAADRAKAATIGEMATRAQLEVMAAGRETVQRSAPVWRRVSDGNPCGWCAMLVGRGPVYRSAETAGAGNRYHTRCGCTAEPFDGRWEDWQPTPDEQRMVDAYRAVFESGMRADEVAVRIERWLAANPPALVAVADDVAAATGRAVAAVVVDEDTVRTMRNADLDTQMRAAWEAEDWDSAALFEDEIERRNKIAGDWGFDYDDYDHWAGLDVVGDAADDLPDMDDIPEPPRLSRRQVRAQWEDEQDLRIQDAELAGGGILPELADEARAKGITLRDLMNGDPRTAYKYANQELLNWWDTNGGRHPIWELEAAHGRLDARTLAKRRLTEDKARTLAQELLGKNRREAMAARDAAKARQRRATRGPLTEGDKLEAARRRYQRAKRAGEQ